MITVVVALSAGATAATAVGVNMIPEVTPPPLGWSVNGAAEPVAAGFRLTHAGRHDEAGSAFWNNVVSLTAPTGIEFDADLGGGGAPGADGLALVFADAQRGGSPHVAGENASAIGYGGIPGVAVILDTYQNIGEPSSNFVGIANGLDENGAPRYLAMTTAVPDLRDGTHHVQVDTARNHVDVVIDGRLALSRSVALPGTRVRRVHRRERRVHRRPRGHEHPRRRRVGHRVDRWRRRARRAARCAGTNARAGSVTRRAPRAPCAGVPMLNGQADIDAAPAGTTFCLSGTHNWSLTPKRGDRFVGPAVLDGGHTTTYTFEPGSATDVVLAQLEIRNYAPGYQTRGDHVQPGVVGMDARRLAGARQRHRRRRQRTGGRTALAGAGRPVLRQPPRRSHERVRHRRDRRRGGDRPQQLHRRQLHDGERLVRRRGRRVQVGRRRRDRAQLERAPQRMRRVVGRRDTRGATITGNQVHDNWAEGIFVEISHDATVTGNTVSGNGFRSFRGSCARIWMYGGGITVAASDNVTVLGNTVTGNCNGITATQEHRGDALLEHVTVANNTIAGPGGKTGAAVYPVSIANLLLRDITFAGNTITNGMSNCGLQC